MSSKNLGIIGETGLGFKRFGGGGEYEPVYIRSNNMKFELELHKSLFAWLITMTSLSSSMR